jgi:hypothetical protein
MPPDEGVSPFRIAYSVRCIAHARRLLEQAKVMGLFDEFAQAGRGLHARLEWIPMDFGEPTCEFVHLGLQEYIGTVPPFVVTYTVDEHRRIVYVMEALKLLPKSRL